MNTVDVLRVIVVCWGGVVAGTGVLVLGALARTLERGHWRRSVVLLELVNVLVTAYIAFSIFGRWHEPLSWRTSLAVVIFTLKGTLIYSVRAAGKEQP
jgi:hypothetical protein